MEQNPGQIVQIHAGKNTEKSRDLQVPGGMLTIRLRSASVSPAMQHSMCLQATSMCQLSTNWTEGSTMCQALRTNSWSPLRKICSRSICARVGSSSTDLLQCLLHLFEDLFPDQTHPVGPHPDVFPRREEPGRDCPEALADIGRVHLREQLRDLAGLPD